MHWQKTVIPCSEIPLTEASVKRSDDKTHSDPFLGSPVDIRAVDTKTYLESYERTVYYYILETEGTDEYALFNYFIDLKSIFSFLCSKHNL